MVHKWPCSLTSRIQLLSKKRAIWMSTSGEAFPEYWRIVICANPVGCTFEGNHMSRKGRERAWRAAATAVK